VIKLLQPFVITSWHGAGEREMPPDIKEIYSSSELAKDPKKLNIFVFLLDAQGKPLHNFHGVPGRDDGRADYAKEISAGLAKLKPPGEAVPSQSRPARLPDLPAAADGGPAGIRLFLHSQGRQPVVELVPMSPKQWKTLAFPDKSRDIEAADLQHWLVQLYPPAIRTVDQLKPFKTFTGVLRLEPAGAADNVRFALLRGRVKLAKGDESESGFEGTVELVLSYSFDEASIQSVLGVIEGDYLYRIRGTQRLPLKAAIESRP